MNNISKKKKKIGIKRNKDFDPNKILVNKRKLFLTEVVNGKTAFKLIKELMALDSQRKAPIYLYLNTPGGNCASGMAIINTIRNIQSKVITIINTEVCSMGAHISISGNERWMDINGIWMAHDMSGGVDGEDYSMKVIDRAKFQDKYYNKVLNGNLRKYTKLSELQIRNARAGELWLFADEAIECGIADKNI